MEKLFTLIFPMAGKGARFGYKFKPFLEIEGKGTFIEIAFTPFRKHLHLIEKVIFVFLEEQEKEFDVSSRLKNIFFDINFEVTILQKQTDGPAETVRKAIDDKKLDGPLVICDCDHTLNIDNFVKKIQLNNHESILPVWSLAKEKIKSWSIASIIENGRVTGIAEKELPKTAGEFFGVIGCYYIKNPKLLENDNYKNISDCIKDMINNNYNVTSVKINIASFFGDPERLGKTLKLSREKGTIFCDLDGTLIEHEDNPSTIGINLLSGSVEKINSWAERGYFIVLVTARSPLNKDYLKAELARKDIKYDELVMGLSSGPRIIINDRKPSDILKPTAIAYEVTINIGVRDIDIDIPEVKVIKRMKGGSYADTFLIQNGGNKYIRKIASKTSNIELGYLRLKKQYNQLSRFSSFEKSIVPNLIKEEENTFEYFFDMEYLEGYSLLSECNEKIKIKASETLLNLMSNNIYIQTAILQKKNNWLAQHVKNKISNKIKPEIYKGKLTQILKHNVVEINGINFENISKIIEKLLDKYSEILSPKFLCPIHGDLTFENILCQEEFGLDVKLIDMDGAEYLDAIELDMGKMFQSVITRYEDWSQKDENLVESSKNGIILNYEIKLETDLINKFINIWSDVLNEDKLIIKAKAYFYTSLHLIRMIRFRQKVSEDQAMFALLNSYILLDKSFEVLSI